MATADEYRESMALMPRFADMTTDQATAAQMQAAGPIEIQGKRYELQLCPLGMGKVLVTLREAS